MATWKTKGTCSSKIHFDIENNIVKELQFEGGCPGNSLGLASLVIGMKIEDAIDSLKGIKCGAKETSCPDQLAQALISWGNAQR